MTTMTTVMHFLCILSIAIAVAVEIPQIDDHTENRFARVAYGEDYDHEKYEYVVMLLGEDENSSEIASLCSGSLLSPIAVLTAAHCTYGMTASKLTVVVPKTASDDVRQSEVQKIYQHPAYKKLKTFADLSLLKIKRPFISIKRFASIAGLPSDFVGNTGRKCVAIGFGDKAPGDMSENGQIINITIQYGSDKCKSMLEDDGFSNELGKAVHEEFLCSTNDNHTVCHGDSGGPLICGEHQFGVSSNVIVGEQDDNHCGRYEDMSRFVFLYHYRDWISSSMDSINDGKSDLLHHRLFVNILATLIVLCVQN